MSKPIWLALCACALAPALSRAQEPQALLGEFREIALRETPSAETRQKRNQDMEAWLERAGAVDLGEDAYALDIARYFLRRYDEAAAGLLEYLREREGFPTKDFDTIIGRIFLNGAMTRIRAESYDAAAKMIDLAARHYDKPDAVYRYAGALLKRAAKPAASALLVELTSKILQDARLSDEQRLEALKAIYTPRRRANSGEPVQPGSFKTFTATTMDGKKISPQDFKGKVLLIDYWATWCGPCMREVPNVVSAYEKYAPKGFAIIGISLDKAGAEERIRETTRKFHMTWPQIYDGKYWDAELAVLNGVRSIPATFLFDRSGKLRYARLRGEELERRVAELLEEEPAGGGERR